MKLERSLGFWEVTLMSVGIILGAGVYVLIGEASGLSGNGLWISFIFAAVVASFTGLSYAELSSRFPEAGAEYVYVEHSFGKNFAWIVGWLIIAGSIIGAATVAIGFANYFSALFKTPIVTIALAVLVVCGIILIIGVKETAAFTILFTLIEAAGLFVIIAIGLPYFGTVNYLEFAEGMKGVIEAGVLIFFGYIGFESITRLASETKDPERNIPRAIIFSIIITTIIYILVGISAVSVVSWQQLSQSEAPLAIVAQQIFGENSFIILSAIALFSTFNTVLVMLLSGSRIIYGIAEKKALPKFFLIVSKKTLTPWVSIICVIGIATVFLIFGNIKTVANLTNFTIFATFILVNSSLIYLRIKKPISSGFRVPLSIKNIPILPVFGIITSFFMIINLSYDVLLIGLVLIIVGFIVHFLLIRYDNLKEL
ncbi:MAG: amino acid permease [Candidatus Thermoplasmatota archaeon]|nr:amino acid permease [Candidatus Thermoplasmatota archaeon]